jgi:hypothetical protein
MVLEQAIRQRSYEIWQREGCPDGKADDHWLQAKAELEAEHRAASFPWSGTDCRKIVVSRLPISPPPLRVTSRRATRTAA